MIGRTAPAPPRVATGMKLVACAAWLACLALTGRIRREVFTDPWNDRTQLRIGLAWRKRAPISDAELRWRD